MGPWCVIFIFYLSAFFLCGGLSSSCGLRIAAKFGRIRAGGRAERLANHLPWIAPLKPAPRWICRAHLLYSLYSHTTHVLFPPRCMHKPTWLVSGVTVYS